jgi:hypothetical protein
VSIAEGQPAQYQISGQLGTAGNRPAATVQVRNALTTCMH